MRSNEKTTGSFVAGREHVLLVCPLTFSYHVSISECLQTIGYDVTWWNDRASSATWYKLALRLFPAWTIRWSEQVFLNRLSQLNAESISHILVIKGEGMSPRVLLTIRVAFPSASMGLYLWDSAENVKSVSNNLPAFDSVATFDPADARTFGWTYRPLFWRNISFGNGVPAQTLFDWCFIGTIHSDRHSVIHRLRQGGGTHVRNFVFSYFQSPLILLIRSLIDWTIWVAPSGTLSTKSLPADVVAQKVASSKAVLDVEHPRQRGLTMRTIETLMAGKKLITTNKLILNSNLYHPSRIQVICRNEPEIPSGFMEETFLSIPDTIRNYYSCKEWVTELLELQEVSKIRGKQS